MCFAGEALTLGRWHRAGALRVGGMGWRQQNGVQAGSGSAGARRMGGGKARLVVAAEGRSRQAGRCPERQAAPPRGNGRTPHSV